MNSRERIINILNRKPVDRFPVDIWHVPEITADLYEHFNVHNDIDLYKKMGVDKWMWIGVPYTGNLPELEGEAVMATQWGVQMRTVKSGKATYHEEKSMMDLVLEPEFLNAALDKIESIQTEIMKRFFEKAADYVDAVFISDDMGSQNSLLFSPVTWDEIFRPRMKRWCDFLHSYGIKVFFHSDGACEPLIPKLIDVGIDVLNPIQHICPGMDMAELKEKYGKDLIFHGAVDTQDVLPFRGPEEVKKETLDCLQKLGKGGEGFICCSCHNIQAGTPIENILAMVDTVKSYKI